MFCKTSEVILLLYLFEHNMLTEFLGILLKLDLTSDKLLVLVGEIGLPCLLVLYLNEIIL